MLREGFGTDGHGNDVELVTLENANGTQAKISTLGAALVSFVFRDREGVMRDVVLGYDDPLSYIKYREFCFGASVGRNANRTSGAKITIGGVEYALEANSEGNNLHSGSNGVSYRLWDIERMDEAENNVVFHILSPDLEQGFPGNMTIRTTYTLTNEDELKIKFEAVSDKETVANFTNHSYFNLAGHDQGYIGKQKLKIYANAFTPLSAKGSIPTGEIRLVEGTPLDFRKFKEFDDGIDDDYEQIAVVSGYDHNFVLDNHGKLELMAEAVCEETGIHLYAYTDCPGMQLYAGNFIYEHEGKGGAVYGRRHGFCLESQYYPDAFRHPAFPKPLLAAGETYCSETIYKLGLD